MTEPDTGLRTTRVKVARVTTAEQAESLSNGSVLQTEEAPLYLIPWTLEILRSDLNNQQKRALLVAAAIAQRVVAGLQAGRYST